MKLYIKPGACSMASHIILAEIGGDYAVEMVDTVHGETASGANYREINPKSKVPALEVEGEVLTEGPAILQFLGDRSANRDLAPSPGTMARARVNEMLNFTGIALARWPQLSAFMARIAERASVQKVMKAEVLAA